MGVAGGTDAGIAFLVLERQPRDATGWISHELDARAGSAGSTDPGLTTVRHDAHMVLIFATDTVGTASRPWASGSDSRGVSRPSSALRVTARGKASTRPPRT